MCARLHGQEVVGPEDKKEEVVQQNDQEQDDLESLQIQLDWLLHSVRLEHHTRDHCEHLNITNKQSFHSLLLVTSERGYQSSCSADPGKGPSTMKSASAQIE